jgi:hypothetical protein
MDSGNRPARPSRPNRRGWARVAAQLAVPVALGLLIGGVLAYQAGSTNDAVHPTPLGAVPSPTPSFGKPSTPAPTSTLPVGASPASSPASTATPAATRSYAVKHTAAASAPRG